MNGFPPTIIVRHRKENLKKCSLKGLEQRPGFSFVTYPLQQLSLNQRSILLSLDTKEELKASDKDFGLLIIDATWRYANKMQQALHLPSTVEKKRLPTHFQTAYPRRQHDCADPTKGLASIEAIVCAFLILERSAWGLLDHYYWKDSFLEKNKSSLLQYPYGSELFQSSQQPPCILSSK